MLSQQDQEMWRNVPDPSFAGGSHLCGSGAGNELASQPTTPPQKGDIAQVHQTIDIYDQTILWGGAGSRDYSAIGCGHSSPP